MGVREAKAADRPSFHRLLVASLHEEHSLGGSHVLPTGKSIQFYVDYFNSYTSGSRFGVCLLWESPEGEVAGYLLAGEPWDVEATDSSLGRTATIWNIYVEPAHRKSRIADTLLARTLDWLRTAGFDTMSCHTLPLGTSARLVTSRDAIPRGVWYTIDLNHP